MAKPWLTSYEDEIPHSLNYPDHPVPQFLVDTALRCPDDIATTLNEEFMNF